VGMQARLGTDSGRATSGDRTASSSVPGDGSARRSETVESATIVRRPPTTTRLRQNSARRACVHTMISRGDSSNDAGAGRPGVDGAGDPVRL